jgi:hypothetical protein
VAHYFELGENITILHWLTILVKTTIKVTHGMVEEKGRDWNELEEGEPWKECLPVELCRVGQICILRAKFYPLRTQALLTMTHNDIQ